MKHLTLQHQIKTNTATVKNKEKWKTSNSQKPADAIGPICGNHPDREIKEILEKVCAWTKSQNNTNTAATQTHSLKDRKGDFKTDFFKETSKQSLQQQNIFINL